MNTSTISTIPLTFSGNVSWWRRATRMGVAILALAGLGACATVDSGVAAYDRAQQSAAVPVLQMERLVEDAGARITGTTPAYQKGETFFINSEDHRSAFGTD